DPESIWIGLVAVSLSTGTIIWVMSMYDDLYAKVSIGLLLALLIPLVVIQTNRRQAARNTNLKIVPRVVVVSFIIFVTAQLFVRPDVVDAVSVFIGTIPVATVVVIIYNRYSI
ncbi:MAG: hypothetical protein V5A21_10225, partial [Halapricum sp.]